MNPGKKAIIMVGLLATLGCTTVSTPQGNYSTMGQAHIQECDQMVFPEGMGDKKEAIGFNCRSYQSEGVSSEFTAIVKVLFSWIPWPW